MKSRTLPPPVPADLRQSQPYTQHPEILTSGLGHTIRSPPPPRLHAPTQDLRTQCAMGTIALEVATGGLENGLGILGMIVALFVLTRLGLQGLTGNRQ